MRSHTAPRRTGTTRTKNGSLRAIGAVVAIALAAVTVMLTAGGATASQNRGPSQTSSNVVIHSAAAVAWPVTRLATSRAPRKHGNPPPTAQLPPDWPRRLPVPAGQIQGSTGAGGQWSVLILTRGSAAAVHSRAMRFYIVRGFTRVADSVLRRGRLRIVVVTENRDHSAAKTNLLLGVTRR